MIITVKILQGKECSLEVTTSSLISSIKQQVAMELDIPVDQQRLVFKGKTLADGQCLRDYNIVDGNKLHLFVRKNEEPTDTPENTPTSVLWDHLQKTLDKYYTPENTRKILEEFKKNFEHTYKSLSLDDIERLAIYNMDGNMCNGEPGKETC